MPTADFFREGMKRRGRRGAEDAKKDQIKKLFALCAFALKHRSWSTPGFRVEVRLH